MTLVVIIHTTSLLLTIIFQTAFPKVSTVLNCDPPLTLAPSVGDLFRKQFFQNGNFNPDSWILYLRIQKTGSKTLANILLSHGQLPGHALVGNSNSDCLCSSLELCPCHTRPIKCVGCYKKYACSSYLSNCFANCEEEKCRVIAGPHADFIDLQISKWKNRWYTIPNAKRLLPEGDEIGIYNETSAPPLLITLLRLPSHRLLSEFNHVISLRENGSAWDYYIPGGSSLQSFLANPKVSNRQTRMIAGVSSDPWQKHFASMDDMFATAKVNLKTFAFVGIMENFTASVTLLQYTLGLKPISTFRIIKSRFSDGQKHLLRDLSKEEVRALAKANFLDDRLYKYGKDIFQKRWHTLLSTQGRDRPSFYNCRHQLCSLINMI